MRTILSSIMLLIVVNLALANEPEWVTYNISNSPLPSNWILSLAKDQDNNIWAGTFSHQFAGVGGVVKISNTGWTLYDTSNSDLRNNSVISIVTDNNNNKWFGCAMKFETLTSSVVDSGGFSRLNGNTWSNWMLNSFYSDNVQDLAIDANNNVWAAVGTFFLQGSPIHGYVAKFNGNSWQVFNRAFFNLPNNNSFRCIAVDNNNITWIGTTNNGLIRFDGSNYTIFNNTNSQVPSNNIYELEIAPDGKLWVGTDFGLGIYNGTDWTVYRANNSGITHNYIAAIAFEGNISWIGTLNSLLKFDGNNWTKFDTANSQIPGGVVDVILTDNVGNKWLGTRDFSLAYGLTVFKEGGIVGLNNITGHTPTKYLLKQNYPNPFNPVTKIDFELPKYGNTSLKIYNSIGELIATLVDITLNKGNYSYEWDAANYPSGIYFYTLQSGEYVQTQKMVLLK